MLENIKDTAKYLKGAGIKPSLQRMKIFEHLAATKTHPTIDSMYNGLVSEIPTLSKTTVYNTMKLFHQLGIVNVVNIEDNETRYDADISFHGHFKCTKCKNVTDFKTPDMHDNLKALNGYTITESHYYVKGICADCKSKEN